MQANVNERQVHERGRERVKGWMDEGWRET
jgi:hypothetical protein